MESAVDRIEPGELLAHQYRIDRLIGAGGFAKVYRAIQTELDRTVAVKILHPRTSPEEASPSTRAVERFEREAKLVSRLRNPHTVTVYDYGELPDGRLFMVMEHVDGKTLSQIIDQEGELAPDRIVRILKQVLASLREAHAQEIIHRDIKPGNVMVFDRIGQQDCVKVLDFGVAKSVAIEQRGEADLTVEGAVIGTPKYMSPEQLQGRPLTPASDLFSVGILAYLMYIGDVPYKSNTPKIILETMKELADGVEAFDDAPEPLRSTVTTLLEPNVDHRFQTAEEAIAALEEEPSTGDSVPTGRPQVADRSATFPMGFDPEGQMESTELTATDSSSGGAVTPEPPRTGPANSEPTPTGQLPNADSGTSATAIETPRSPSASVSQADQVSRTDPREVTTATQSSGEAETEAGAGWSPGWWMAVGAGTAVAVFGVVWLTMGVSDRSGANAADPEVAPSEQSAAPDGPSPTSDRQSGAAIEEARGVVHTGVIGSGRAAREAGTGESNDSESATEATAGSAPDEREHRPDRPEPAPAGTPENNSTASEERETKETDERSGDSSRGSGVQPFDEMDRANDDEKGATSEDDESSNEFDIKAWE